MPREVIGVGIAGVTGFGGGFGKHALAPWGEPVIKQFVHAAVEEALKLEKALARLRAPSLVALLHYAPIAATVEGEPLEIYPFLGSQPARGADQSIPGVARVSRPRAPGTPEGRDRQRRRRLQRVDAAADANVSRSTAVPGLRGTGGGRAAGGERGRGAAAAR